MDPFSIPDKYNFHGDHELPWGPKEMQNKSNGTT